jgi:spore coat polysaccharide biosynthesis predicted glycosyltransferase SpsG
MNRVSIVYEANKKVGFGHFTRCKNLFDYLKKSQMDACLIDLKTLRSWKEFSDQTIVIDISFATKIDLHKIFKSAKLLIGLDWFQEQKVDINIVAYAHKHPEANLEVYQGFEYLMIDPKISALKPYNGENLGQRVLTMVGGGDVKQIGLHVADQLHDRGYDVHLVRGPFSAPVPDNRPYKISINEKNIPRVISEADWMVTNGGGCLFEALAAGRPALAFDQTKFESTIIKECFRQSAILGNGLEDLHKPKQLQKIIAAGKRLVDGRGLERITRIIEKAS